MVWLRHVIYMWGKGDEIIGGFRKLHNEELYSLLSSPNIIRMIKSRKMKWAGRVARMGEKRNACRFLVGKPEGKTSLGRPRRKWEDNIEKDLREIRFGGMDWIHLAQDMDQWRGILNKVRNLLVQWNIGKFLSSWATGGFSRTRLQRGSSMCMREVRNVYKILIALPRLAPEWTMFWMTYCFLTGCWVQSIDWYVE
jgi:hypothetical protein